MKQLILAFAFSSASFGATVFVDSVNVVTGMPPAPYTLDSTPYMNTVIGQGQWEVSVSPFSTISSFEIIHSIFLFGSGSLDIVKVYGSTGGAVSLTVNPGLPAQQTFLGSSGSLPNEYVFSLNNFSLGQGGSTLISGFGSINTINFSGSYSVIPEPSGMMLTGAATISFLLRRRRN